jgi:hypothetical protein
VHSGISRANLWLLASCGALLAVALGIYWWLAVPRHEICPMIRPAPAGCNSARVPVAAFWSAATAGAYGILMFLKIKRPRSRWTTIVLLALIFGVFQGYFSVLYA